SSSGRVLRLSGTWGFSTTSSKKKNSCCHRHNKFLILEIGPHVYALGFAFSFTLPPCFSMEYSTVWQPYCFRISPVFCSTNFLNESRLGPLFSPAALRASERALKSASTFLPSALGSAQAM